jgi:hypothetical protein
MGAGVSGRIPEDTPRRAADAVDEHAPERETVTAGAPSGPSAPAHADKLLSHPPRPRKKKRR